MGPNEQPDDEAKRGTEEEQTRKPVGQHPDGGHALPLFLRGRSDGRRGDAQDEKDETGE